MGHRRWRRRYARTPLRRLRSSGAAAGNDALMSRSVPRSLLNTARLMDENPTLLRLKELETLEKVTERIDKLTVYGVVSRASLRASCASRRSSLEHRAIGPGVRPGLRLGERSPSLSYSCACSTGHRATVRGVWYPPVTPTHGRYRSASLGAAYRRADQPVAHRRTRQDRITKIIGHLR
jgi:hypothetical protein